MDMMENCQVAISTNWKPLEIDGKIAEKGKDKDVSE